MKKLQKQQQNKEARRDTNTPADIPICENIDGWRRGFFYANEFLVNAWGCGNLTQKGSTAYSWIQGRKLSGIQTEDGTDIRYAYDHTGARVKKTVNGVTTEYRMAGSLLMSERTGSESIWYQYDSSANLIAVIFSGVRYGCLRNAQNDIVGLIDKDGKRIVYYKYDSRGNTVSITGSLAESVGKKNPFRYRGYYYDAESGLYYLQSRYYDPEIGRWISFFNRNSSVLNVLV